MRSPDDQLALALAIPVAASLCIALVVAWVLTTPWTEFAVDQARMLIALAIALPAHELLRVSAFPRAPGRPWLCVECSKSRLALDSGYDADLPRARLLWVLTAPFVLGSALPTFLCAALRMAPDFIVLLTLTNALLCGADALLLVLVLAQVPGAGIVRLAGDAVRWKASSPAPASPLDAGGFARG